MSADERRRFAEAVVGGSESHRPWRVGGFTLRAEQARTVRTALRSVDAYGGVLIADPPGSGKTVIALAIAAALHARRGASRDVAAGDVAAGDVATRVIAPAALRSQWLESAARAGVGIQFLSLESLSRRAANEDGGAAIPLIVDEAHHLRTVTTLRYSRVAALCADAPVILLSATPVVNRAADRTALLALFLGAKAAGADAALVLVRADARAPRPAVRRLGAIRAGVNVDGIARALRELPPPLPLAGGAAATALVRMTLALAWRSSLAALDAALRRRLQRGEAMRDLLRDGRRPTRDALRLWLLDGDATQLALGALLAPADESLAHGAESSRGMAGTLDVHLAAVRALRASIAPHVREDASRRATALAELLAAHGGRRAVVFARHAETVRALFAALRGVPGVVAIVGERVMAAAGRWSRDEVLRAVGPRAAPLRDGDPRAIRLLLATDVVAEGVEMQGIGLVVHADLPWTPARIAQRVGRVARVGSPDREVLEAWFASPRGATRLIRLGARLRTKAGAGREATAAARATSAVFARLRRWASGSSGSEPRAAPGGVLLALIESNGERALLAGRHDGARWRLSTSPARIARAMRQLERAAIVPTTPSLPRLIERFLAARRAAESLGDVEASRLTRTRARLARLLERAPALVRAPLAEQLARLGACLARPIGVAKARALDALLRDEPDDDRFARRLGALLRAAREPTAPAMEAERRPGAPGRLIALLATPAAASPQSAQALSAVRPPAPHPRVRRAASPGSAATR